MPPRFYSSTASKAFIAGIASFFVVPRLLFVVLSVGLYFVAFRVPSAFAAATYSRSPSGTGEISPPVTITIQADSASDLADPGTALSCIQYWQIGIDEAAFSSIYPSTTLSVSFDFHLPAGSYDDVVTNVAPVSSDPITNVACGGKSWESGMPLFVVKAGPGGATNVRPGIDLIAPQNGSLLQGETKIRWRAFDPDPEPWGLATSPMSLFYSTDRGITFKAIATDTANTGEYIWDTRQVPDGNYEVKILVKDGRGLTDFVRAINLLIDNNGPQFSLKFDPLPAAPDRFINITGETNEDATKTQPILKATAPGREKPDLIPLEGSGKSWKGRYKIPRGVRFLEFDVDALDQYGNNGSVVVGKRLPVEVLVKTPTIDNIADSLKTGNDTLDVVGKTEPNLTIHLLINGKDKYTAKPDGKGSYKIPAAKLTLENKGHNKLVLWAENKDADISEEVIRKVIYNVPPTLRFLNPSRISQIISGETIIKWEAVDPNEDEITFTLELNEGGTFTWFDLGKNLKETSLTFNSADFSDGTNYRFRLKANDGFGTSEIASRPFIIKNGLPTVRLNVPQPIFLQKRTFEFPGEASAPGSTLFKVEYSLDNGATWHLALAKDGLINSAKEEVILSQTRPIAPGEYILLLRATASDGKIGHNRARLTIDATPPTLAAQGTKGLTRDRQPQYRGNAKDDISGIEAVEFSFDRQNWFRTSLVSGYQTKSTEFIFQPVDPLEDGTYTLYLRSADRAGNTRETDPVEFTVDTTSPRVGGRELSFAGIPLYPNADGQIVVLPEKDYRLRISIAGDPTEVKLLADPNLRPSQGLRLPDLELNRRTGVWETTLRPSQGHREAGLRVYVRDEIDNERTANLLDLEVNPPPKVLDRASNQPIAKAKVRTLAFDEDRKEFRTWDANSFGQQNPATTNDQGEFALILPAGTYRLEVKARGFHTLKSNPFTLKTGQVFTQNLSLKKR